MNGKALLSTIFALSLVTGCLKPSPATVFHTLTPTSEKEAGPASTTHLSMEVMPIHLPEMIQRPQLVTAKGPSTYGLSETHHWGNPLDKDIQRVLTENLSTLLDSDNIVASPHGGGVLAACRLALDVQRCDGELGGILRFQAIWTVTETSTGRVLLLRRSSLQEPVKGHDHEALVWAHNRILAALSREMASELKKLNE